MKKLIMFGIIAAVALMSACSFTGTTQSAQVRYVQACSAYGAALNTAVSLREKGKLSAKQISDITVLDAQITPICTGPLPASPDAATQQVTAAITTLTVLETIEATK